MSDEDALENTLSYKDFLTKSSGKRPDEPSKPWISGDKDKANNDFE